MNEVNVNKIRLDYVDVAKFVAIFFVIFCHIQGRGEIIHIAYSFHLPIFFILNGITLKIKDESFGQFLEKKIKSYIIPMFFLGFILIFAEIIKSQNTSNPLDIKYFGTMIINMLEQKRVYPLWFVGALFFSDVFFYFIYKLSRDKSYGILIGSLIFLGIAIICNKYYKYRYVWNIDVSLFGVFFVGMGYLFNHKDMTNIREFLLKNRIISLFVGLLLVVLGQIFGEYNFHTYNTYLEMWGMSYDKYYLVIPCAVFSSFGVILISNAMRNKVLVELGKTTLVLLAFHQIITIPIFNQDIASNWYESIRTLEPNNINYLTFSFASTLFSIVTLVMVYYFIVYSPFAFILNKKTKPFYKETILKLKSKLSKKS